MFKDTTALIQLQGIPGTEGPVPFILRGPAEAHVFFEGANEGDADDSDGNGLDDVATQLMSLNLRNTAGNVVLSLNNSAGASVGQIEEKDQFIAGVLDLDPFGEGGSANSFFDVFFEITVDGFVVHNGQPLRIEAMIDEKPPEGGRYFHIVPTQGPIQLLDAAGRPTGIFIVSAEHNTGHVEIDEFEFSLGQLELVNNDTGGREAIPVSGPTTVHVFFEGGEGAADDDDDNGREEVQTEMVALDLRGNSSLGPVRVTLDDRTASTGFIEERTNNTAGTLDVSPFTEVGLADSRFDLNLRVEVDTPNGLLVLFSAQPKVLRTTISHKPPAPGDLYEGTVLVPLVDIEGNDSGFSLGAAFHRPDPGTVERDFFEDTTALIQLQGIPGTEGPVPFILRGPAEAHVFFEGANEGDADDSDGNGLDDVATQLMSLNLRNTAGNVVLSLNNSAGASVGQIEEKDQFIAGVLDLDPFGEGGSANSFFDVFFEITVDGFVVHNGQPLRIEAMIDEKPPEGGRYFHIVPTQGPIQLLDAAGRPTGIFIVSAEHNTGHVEIDEFEFSLGQLELVNNDTGGREAIPVSGPTTVHVFFEGGEGAADDDDDNGREEVQTEMVALDLRGNSSLVRCV